MHVVEAKKKKLLYFYHMKNKSRFNFFFNHVCPLDFNRFSFYLCQFCCDIVFFFFLAVLFIDKKRRYTTVRVIYLY